MHARQSGGNVRGMPLWLLTILICAALWVVGTIVIALGARWLMRTQAD